MEGDGMGDTRVDAGEDQMECRVEIVVVTDRCDEGLNALAETAFRSGLGFRVIWADAWYRTSIEQAYLRSQPRRRLLVLTDAVDVALNPTCTPSLLRAKHALASVSSSSSPVLLSAGRDAFNPRSDPAADHHHDEDEISHLAEAGGEHSVTSLFHHPHPATLMGEAWALDDLLTHLLIEVRADPVLAGMIGGQESCSNPIHPTMLALTRAHMAEYGFLGRADTTSKGVRRVTDRFDGSATGDEMGRRTPYVGLDEGARVTVVLDGVRVGGLLEDGVERVLAVALMEQRDGGATAALQGPCFAHFGGLVASGGRVSSRLRKALERLGFENVRRWRRSTMVSGWTPDLLLGKDGVLTRMAAGSRRTWVGVGMLALCTSALLTMVLAYGRVVNLPFIGGDGGDYGKYGREEYYGSSGGWNDNSWNAA
ncbi:hypothetical protein HK101_005349 [Irineochytrium annulatum]|nr:hypothetical protein HK101_005349 [Irineochytrium annulatum]